MADQPAAQQQNTGNKKVAVIATIIILCIIGFLVWLLGWSGIVGDNSNAAANDKATNQQTKALNTTRKTQVKTNWETFFNGKTPAATRVSLLQNGQEFVQVIDQLSKTPTAQTTTATVSNVELNGKTATVTYTLNVNGSPVLKDQTGHATLTNGSWVVSDDDFCGLLALQGTTPPNCPKPSGSSSASPGQQPSGATDTQSQSQAQSSKSNN